jgi:hypothetical protein
MPVSVFHISKIPKFLVRKSLYSEHPGRRPAVATGSSYGGHTLAAARPFPDSSTVWNTLFLIHKKIRICVGKSSKTEPLKSAKSTAGRNLPVSPTSLFNQCSVRPDLQRRPDFLGLHYTTNVSVVYVSLPFPG